MSTKYFLGIGILIAIVLAGIMLYLIRPGFFSPTLWGGTTASTTIIDVGGGIHVPTTGEGVNVLPIENTTAKAPLLDKPIVIVATLDPAAAAAIKSKIEAVVSQLKQDSQQLKLWLQLGTYRKMAGDYAGAAEAWDYVAAAAPSNYIAFNNLGDLYMNFTKDYPKAETNFLAVITRKPEYIDSYRNLYTLYHYLYKTNTSAASDILKEGLKINPNDPDLLRLQAELNAKAQ
jgi:tetratricopeptide (TPR) repeat protein